MERVQLETEIIDFAASLGSARDLRVPGRLDRGLDLIEAVDRYLNNAYGGGSKGTSQRNIVVIGTSGAGKSTVISFLFGSGRMLVHRETPYSRVLVAENPLAGVAIQSGSTSSTLLPVCSHWAGGVSVWDMPGGQDTRGPFVEMLVHNIYEWMLAKGKSLSFVIVSPPPTERPQRAALEKAINRPFISQDNATVVYTKCSREFDPRSTAGLEIAEEKQNIQSFAMREPRMADDEGHNYSLEHDHLKVCVLRTLARLRSSDTMFNGSLPPATQLLQNEFQGCSIAFARERLSAWSMTVMNVFNRDNYRGAIADLREILQELSSTDELSYDDVMEVFARLARVAACPLRPEADAAVAVAKAKRRLDLLFPTQVLHRISDWLSAEAISTLEQVKRTLAVLISRVHSYRDCFKLTNESSARGRQSKVLVIGAFHLVLSKEKQTIYNFVEKRQQQVETNADIPVVILVGLKSLEVDEELRMWANIALISPLVTVSTVNALDLSALGQAAPVEPENDVAGAIGESGLPGLSGGNLVVVCTELKDPESNLQATRSCGQQGGNAQNGGDGVNGIYSAYNAENFKKELKRWIKRCALPTKDDTFGVDPPGDIRAVGDTYKNKVSPSSGFWYGATGRRECAFQRASMGGTEGIRPGCGGHAGAGGRGGRIRIVESNNVLWDKESFRGKQGSDGFPGKASCNGRKSPSIYATAGQWYYTGRILRGYAEDPEIEVTEGSRPPRVVLEAQPASGSGVVASPNKSLVISSLKLTVQSLYRHLEAEFPRCDFSGVELKWGIDGASEGEVPAA